MYSRCNSPTSANAEITDKVTVKLQLSGETRFHAFPWSIDNIRDNRCYYFLKKIKKKKRLLWNTGIFCLKWMLNIQCFICRNLLPASLSHKQEDFWLTWKSWGMVRRSTSDQKISQKILVIGLTFPKLKINDDAASLDYPFEN